MEERIILAAIERMNPSARDDRAVGGGTLIGNAMIERGEIVARMDPFKDAFELGYQPLKEARSLTLTLRGRLPKDS